MNRMDAAPVTPIATQDRVATNTVEHSEKKYERVIKGEARKALAVLDLFPLDESNPIFGGRKMTNLDTSTALHELLLWERSIGAELSEAIKGTDVKGALNLQARHDMLIQLRETLDRFEPGDRESFEDFKKRLQVMATP